MKNTIQFCGAARHVTGSNFLLTLGNKKILVECGMFQGCHDCEGRNFNDFAYDPKTIDALLVTHAHIDHTGRIPKLVQSGFKGRIISTAPTKDFSEMLLRDSIHIMEDEAKRSHDRSLLYSEADLKAALAQWEVFPFRENIDLGEGIRAQLLNAGHILGSAMVEITFPSDTGEKTIIFTGDLGNPPSIFVPDTEKITKTDYLVIESSYGDRLHENASDRKILLERAVEDVVSKKGVLMVPAFAMERTQELIYELNDLVEHKRVPQLPVFVDSPLATNLTEVFKKYRSYYKDRLAEPKDDVFTFPGLKFTESVEESKAINNVHAPKVIIAGSGMSNAGRILHHELRHLGDPNSILLITGFQVSGSLGRRLLDGVKNVKIFGEVVDVKCEIRQIQGYSAHADQKQLTEFVSTIEKPIRKIFIVHGEENSALTLAQIYRDHLGLDAKVPMWQDVYEL